MAVYVYQNSTAGAIVLGSTAFDVGQARQYSTGQPVFDQVIGTLLNRYVNGVLDNNLADDPTANSITLVGTTVVATGVLPLAALGAVTPYNSASPGTLSLPDAATAWALSPYGIVVISQKAAGVASFAASGSDSLRVTAGLANASVQYGMIAAQIISATEWALA